MLQLKNMYLKEFKFSGIIPFLKNILGLCNHKWEVIDKHSVNVYGEYNNSMPIRFEKNYVMKCTICGNIKHKKIKY